MKKTIPFKKDIVFKTNLSEITSISLEHTLQVESSNLINGEFIVSGQYKMAESSVNVENFSFNIPFEVNIDDKYIIDNIIVDIDDFYYEIINNNMLSINIVVLIDNLKEKPLFEKETKVEQENVNDSVPAEEIISEPIKDIEHQDDVEFENKTLIELEERKELEKTEKVTDFNNVEERITVSLFDKFDDSAEAYITYKVYVVKEGDTIDLIIKNYGINHEELEKYNNLTEINVGDKIIIPFVKNEED